MSPVVIDTNCLLQIIENSHFDILRQIPFPQLNLVTLDEFINTRLVALDSKF